MSKLPLRERKKEMIREAIITNAERLFEERGFDAVTVAEIADAANVSKKTLFTYFRSKEDLLFQDTRMIDEILIAIKRRAKNDSASQAVLSALLTLLREGGDPVISLAAYHRAYGDSLSLQSRLLKMWSDYELLIANELAVHSGRHIVSLDDRFEAARLVLLARSLTWKEALDFAERAGQAALSKVEKWLNDKAREIGH